ncbi:MAG: Gfo/Idh/MocA family oxidoreductase, partial [Spirochaetales bacterium]|nr:Gfo/Idh/MocA family oxidoreductase [Spirochaetales bacterium]
MSPPPSTVRAGFVGAGFAARFHYESLTQARGLGVIPLGVYSRTAHSRRRFAEERGLRAFDTLDELLQAVDVVHVCVPPALHEAVTVAALQRDVHVIVEKPFTGYFGAQEGREATDGQPARVGKERMRDGALASARRMLEAEVRSKGRIFYAENWVFAPVIQKEAEIVRKTRAQILWIIAEESHSGSHSPTYGIWEYSGGGSLMGKGCHPLTAALYLKRLEGTTRNGTPVRPAGVTARTHELTRIPGYEDRGFLRTDYTDVEDFGFMHVLFDDGTVADIFSSEIVLGGVHNWLEVNASNHRTRCNINPIDALETYNPRDEQFQDIYVVEKTGTKQGWSHPAPDEDWMNGYVQEMDSFYRSIQEASEPFAGAELGYDTVAVIYSGY